MLRRVMRKRVPRRPMKKVAKKRAMAHSLTKLQKKEVQVLVRGQAETKRTAFYQDFNNGTATSRATGFYANRGWSIQNQRITTNNTDILQLIPFVTLGPGDFQRIGNRISVTGLHVQGAVRVAISQLQANILTNFKAVIFVYQHVSLKDYTNLYAANDFTQFLETGEGGTVVFNGEQQNLGMPVAKQYYRVVKKLIIPLKWAGFFRPADQTQTVNLGIPNAHVWKADFSLNLTKHLPKVLQFPEAGPPTMVNVPTNSSLAMSMGFVYDTNPSSTFSIPPTALPAMEQSYVTQLSWKDL